MISPLRCTSIFLCRFDEFRSLDRSRGSKTTPNLQGFAIHFPKKFIFPIKKDKYYKTICLPNKQEKLCQFLYGLDWKIPLKKNISYRMEIVNNKPLLIKRSFLGSITRWLKSQLSIN